jgi:uncharacterized protein (TIGR00725 family)
VESPRTGRTTGPRYVAVIGPSECSAAEYDLAVQVGQELAERGAVLLCGGLTGVMEAASRGAAQAAPPGVSIGLLPGEDRSAGNEFLSYALPTALGEVRNRIVIAGADAVIAVGGSAGTLVEMAYALSSGRPVAVLSGWTVLDGNNALVHGFQTVNSPQSAADYALGS